MALSRSSLLLLVLGVLGLPACVGAPAGIDDAGPASDASPASDARPGDSGSSTICTALARTCAQVVASFASNSMNVAVACDAAAGTFTITSTGVPSYDSNQTTPNSIVDQSWVVTLPLTPACAATTTDVLASRGPVGFMINGVPFYGPEDAMGNDAVVNEGPSFDDCDGHADMSCSYHYHEEPICVFGLGDTAQLHAEPDGHPPVIGYALDGFAIYASYETSQPLDGCNGHADATRGYHYHATATSPYLIGCYAGTATGRVVHAMNLCVNGVPTADGGVATTGDAGVMGPPSCTTSADCTTACPPGSMGCTCAPSPMGAMACVPTCTTAADCPAGAPVCDTAMHICHP